MSNRMRWIIVWIVGIVLALIAAWQVNERSAGLDRVQDVTRIDQLQDAFNRDAGSPRLILFVAPT